MAAFTALALLGLGLAGGIAADKVANRNKNPDESTMTGSPHATLGQQPAGPPTAPPSLAITNSAASLAAISAGNKQRKRAAAGSSLAGGKVSTNTAATPKLQPLTLLGY